MVDKVEIPAETQQETQEYRDEMAKKADDANNVANTETAPEPVQQQEEQLILGKFKTQEDLIKSYQELERKQSQPQEEAPKEESKLEANTKVNFDFHKHNLSLKKMVS